MDVAEIAGTIEELVRKEPVNVTVAVTVQLVVNLGFDKGEHITIERLQQVLAENFNEMWHQVNQADAIDRVELLDTERG